MNIRVVDFPKKAAPTAQLSIAEALQAMADQTAGAHGLVLVADMGAGNPPKILVAGQQYENAADAMFLLALGQKRILEAAG